MNGQEGPTSVADILRRTGLGSTSRHRVEGDRLKQGHPQLFLGSEQKYKQRPTYNRVKYLKVVNQAYICWIKNVLFLHLDEYTFIITWKAQLKSRILFLLGGVYTERYSPQTLSVVMTFLSQWLALSHIIKSPMQVCGYTTCTFVLCPSPLALQHTSQPKVESLVVRSLIGG